MTDLIYYGWPLAVFFSLGYGISYLIHAHSDVRRDAKTGRFIK